MKKQQKTGIINFTIDLDSNNIPEKINWEATDSGNQKNDLAWMAVSANEINCDRTINANSEYEKDDFSQTLFQIQHIFFSQVNITKPSLHF